MKKSFYIFIKEIIITDFRLIQTIHKRQLKSSAWSYIIIFYFLIMAEGTVTNRKRKKWHRGKILKSKSYTKWTLPLKLQNIIKYYKSILKTWMNRLASFLSMKTNKNRKNKSKNMHCELQKNLKSGYHHLSINSQGSTMTTKESAWHSNPLVLRN